MKNNLFGPAFKALATVILCFLCTAMSFAQTPASNEPVYLLREYMKVEPGMEADYLKVEAVWKKVHDRRKAEGKIHNWNLSRRVFPSGANQDYDYMTVTSFKSGKELDEANNMTWDYIKKGMSEEDIAIANNTGKTRKIVNRQLDMLLESVQAPVQMRYFEITNMNVSGANSDEMEKMEKEMKAVFQEAINAKNITGWRFGKRIYPRSPNGGSYYRIQNTTSMDDMLKAKSSGFVKTAYKKVYPAKDVNVVWKRFAEISTSLDTELWERVDSTK